MNPRLDPERSSRWVAPIPAETRRHLARRLAGVSEPALEPVSSAPADPADVVRSAASGRIGLVSVTWPGIDHPLWLRAGSGDAAALAAAMQGGVATLQLPFVPRRIMEIGAGAGYLSVALAHAFPDAAIVSIEPVPGRARLHSLNTLPWRRITGVHTPVGLAGARLAVGADAATGVPVLLADREGPLTGVALDQLCDWLGWPEIDLLVVDPAICPALSDPALRSTLGKVRRVAIRLADGDALPPALAGQFPAETHSTAIVPGYALVDRRARSAAPLPRRVPVFDIGGDAMPAELPQGSDDAAFFTIGDRGFRLRPASPGMSPARLVLRRFAAGPARFETLIRVNHPAGPAVRFGVAFAVAGTGRVIHQATRTVGPGDEPRWSFDLPMFFGELDIRFTTELAVDGSNAQAWAEFLDPEFV